MPQLISSKLRETHGGHLADYRVAEATISPYMLLCRSVQSRDTIVQSGLYSTAQGRILFAVHEWRPCFGMGFDPPTHQVWVKLVGLPLQAWTTSRITEILQRFGHLLHILPFGYEGGHFRDITAMVEIKNPRRIPMAYTYREGEYCTQVDIIILSWRLWDHTFFPPPGFPPQNTGPQMDPQPSQNPTPSNYHSHSSSSSTNAPSEPTIDLSSWSPRSRRSSPIYTTHWSKKVQPAVSLTFDDNGSAAATENQRPTSDLQQICSEILLSLTWPPRPITINSLPLHTTLSVLHPALRRPNRTSVTLTHDLSCLLPTMLILAEKEKLQFLTSARTTDPPPFLAKAQVPVMLIPKPRAHVSKPGSQTLRLCMTQNLSRPISNALCIERPISYKQFTYPHLDSAQTHHGPHLLMPPQDCSPPAQPQDLGTDLGIYDPLIEDCEMAAPLNTPLSDSDPAPHISNLVPAPLFSETHNTLSVQTTTESLSSPSSQLEELLVKGKGTQMPTRRSQRLREKRQPSGAPFSPVKKMKKQAPKIAFDLHSHETPLDADMAISILQATGIQINQQAQDMIHLAIQHDTPPSADEESRPSTPLHDHIPPRTMPDDGLVL